MNEEFESISGFIPEEYSGVQTTKRTVQLKQALREFTAGCGASCYEDESNKDVLKCYSRLQNGICVEQEIHIGETDYVCYTNLSGRIKDEDPHAVTSLIMAANEINRELKYGNFEVDSKTGTVHFRSYYEPAERVRLEDLDRLLGEPLWAIETYGAQFLNQIVRSED